MNAVFFEESVISGEVTSSQAAVPKKITSTIEKEIASTPPNTRTAMANPAMSEISANFDMASQLKNQFRTDRY
jgi:hypothetical protein